MKGVGDDVGGFLMVYGERVRCDEVTCTPELRHCSTIL